MQRFYSIAGTVYRVVADDSIMYQDDGVLSEYVTDPSDESCTVEFNSVIELSEPCGELIFSSDDKLVYSTDGGEIRYEGCINGCFANAVMRIHRFNNKKNVELKRSCDRHLTPKTVLNCLQIDHDVIENGGYILHASYIIHNGKAILFTAPSGTGKSTQADLWVKHRSAELVNGDRAVVMATDKGIYAYGIPFSGSSGVGKNVNAPVLAIVYLSQGKQNRISYLKGIDAFKKIYQGCSVNVWNKNDVAVCVDALNATLSAVPVFHLECLPNEAAVDLLQEKLSEHYSVKM